MTLTRPRIALVGFGYWGKNLARVAFQSTHIEFVALCDSSAENLDAFSASYPTVAVYKDLDDLLALDDLDAVILATPAASHASLAARVLDAGKHVFVEKPLAMTTSDAERLADQADAAGLTCMVGHTFLYSVPLIETKRIIDSAEFGDVRYMSSERLNLGRVRSDCDVVWNLGPHDVSIALFLFGEEPETVTAFGHGFLVPNHLDTASASLTFPSGRAAYIRLSWLEPRKTRAVTVVGSKQTIHYDDVSPSEKLSVQMAAVEQGGNAEIDFKTYGEYQWRTHLGDRFVPDLALSEPLLDELNEFARCVAQSARPISDGRFGVSVVRTLEAISLSVAEGSRIVRLDEFGG